MRGKTLCVGMLAVVGLVAVTLSLMISLGLVDLNYAAMKFFRDLGEASK